MEHIANGVVYTVNPAVQLDDSKMNEYTAPQINPLICNKPYAEVGEIKQDPKELITTCQHHTRCSATYCLRVSRSSEQNCHFGSPKPLELQINLQVVEEDGQELECIMSGFVPPPLNKMPADWINSLSNKMLRSASMCIVE